MIFHQINGQTTKISFWSKVSLVLWISLSLAILSFFTFTIFILALIVGVVIFTLGFFRRRPSSIYNQNNEATIYNQNNEATPFSTSNDRPKNLKNDEIIDI